MKLIGITSIEGDNKGPNFINPNKIIYIKPLKLCHNEYVKSYVRVEDVGFFVEETVEEIEAMLSGEA